MTDDKDEPTNAAPANMVPIGEVRTRDGGLLHGKVAIITGASAGIGVGIAERFIAAGARVVLVARRAAEGEAVAARLGPAAAFVQADVAIEANVATVVAYALDRFGRLDCLVNNAGVPGQMVGIADTDAAHFDAVMAVHVRGAMLGMKHAAPAMLRANRGSIVNIASVSGHRAGFSAHSYSTAKAALIHLTRSVAIELGEKGIRVNSISPGPIVTGIFGKAAGLQDAEAERRAAEAVRSVFARFQPVWQAVPRPGLPEDVASAALFLASDAASFVNGQDLAVDGGITAGRPFSVGLADRRAIAEAMRAP